MGYILNLIKPENNGSNLTTTSDELINAKNDENREIPTKSSESEVRPRSLSVKIEEPEVNLMQTINRKISTKNFGTEARASYDIEHYLKNATIRANIKSNKLNDVLKEITRGKTSKID